MDTPVSVKSAAFASKLELGKRLFMDSVLISVLVAFPGASAADQLEASFLNPPPSARPWAYWMWLDGNVTRAGLTADLEAMQRAGMGGAILFDVTQDIPRGPVRFNSPGWRELFKHTVSECRRLGLELDLHNAPGWTGSGGPWITPDLGMQMLASSKTNLAGPFHFKGRLPWTAFTNISTHMVATVAFPALVGEGARPPAFAPKVTASAGDGFQGTNLLDGNPATVATLPAPSPGRQQYIQVQFEGAFTASMLKLTGAGATQAFQGALQVSDDGRAFRTVREFMNSRATLYVEFDSISARYFRVLFTEADLRLSRLQFSELELAPIYRIHLARTKSGLGRIAPSTGQPQSLPAVPPYAVIPLTNIVDLGSKTDEAGNLDWDVPPGLWTVLQFRCVPSGQVNHPVTPEALGLECDKLNKEAIETHFNAFLNPLIRDAGSDAGTVFTATHIDSWEIGYQNWTPRFREEFENQRGYDPLPYLPAVSGRYVAGPEESERFLWDMRRTIADLLADNYAGHLAELAHRHGLQLSIEAYGSEGSGPFDDLLYAARADVPMAEFWLDNGDLSRLNLKAMPSAAHTGGKAIVAAEAFSAGARFAKWQNHPFSLKPLGDAAFCQGINRFVINGYAHQPWLDRRPGMTIGSWGLNYGRTDTWWEQSRAWHEYLARCQSLLQSGLFVADICYLTDEGAYTSPPSPSELQPKPPPGYDYDFACPEVVLKRMSVKDGRLSLPDGMSYRLLVLAPTDRMTPPLLRKIKNLVEAGATVLGPRPIKSPSLSGYPQFDAVVDQSARELWGPCDGRAVKLHTLGKGKIIWGEPLPEVFAASGVPPDFQQLSKTAGYQLEYIHRRIGDAEAYFLANPNVQPSEPETIHVACKFRVAGKRPEFWHPDTGKIEKPAAWREQDGCTVLPIKFDPAGSLFVVFRENSRGLDPVVSVVRNELPDSLADLTFTPSGQIQLLAARTGVYQLTTVSGKKLQTEVKDLSTPVAITGPWDLRFPQNAGAPERVTLPELISWSANRDPGVKYFSGTATYTKVFRVPPELVAQASSLSPSPEQRWLHLNLGKVQVIAQLKINGHDFGILWKPPFETDITSAVKVGDNLLEIKVVNLWPNRLIGDEQLPDDCQWQPGGSSGQGLAGWPNWLLDGKPSPTGRLAFATWKHWTKDSPLLESGLLGPVVLRTFSQVEAK